MSTTESGLTVMPTVTQAVDKLIDLYETSCATARRAIDTGDYAAYAEVVYPRLVVDITQWRPIDRTEPFGYVNEAGRYTTEVSKPAVMQDYLREQLERLTGNYESTILVGPGETRIPPEYIADMPDVSEARRTQDGSQDVIPRPTLDDVHDAIIDGKWEAFHGKERPLFHFGPQRFDIACARIRHYTGIDVDTLQKYILFTNYAMHTTEFVKFGLRELADPDSRYTRLILPVGETLTAETVSEADIEDLTLESAYQMPRYDLATDDGDGITMINIGVGPSNAKTITDCLAVLRPEAWIMIGHCAGLDGRMRIGDLILGNAYQREDHILDGRIDTACPSRPYPKSSARWKPPSKRSTATPRPSCAPARCCPPTTATGSGTPRKTCGNGCAAPPRRPSTWSPRPWPPTATATASPTERCCRSPTCRCTPCPSCPPRRRPSTKTRSRPT